MDRHKIAFEVKNEREVVRELVDSDIPCLSLMQTIKYEVDTTNLSRKTARYLGIQKPKNRRIDTTLSALVEQAGLTLSFTWRDTKKMREFYAMIGVHYFARPCLMNEDEDFDFEEEDEEEEENLRSTSFNVEGMQEDLCSLVHCSINAYSKRTMFYDAESGSENNHALERNRYDHLVGEAIKHALEVLRNA